ncbi:outer membrane protein [Nostoc parmelioides]|uniref:Porin family protein n=1 Tax=Nostoc parmelioides FACHB-3921 TaxID=2692909 RepID=A0ABR8BGA7_9NOSO|nr:outer membrane beta-barrel protein [Nostoc parmelioides]MBD2252082.1 porin family protein [Nostoc parmelioides FACHB-3921]
MKVFCCALCLAIPVSLSLATSAHAEAVSTNASDLIPVNQSQVMKSEVPDFLVTQNINPDNSSQLPAKNYWYVSGSVGAGFPDSIRVKQGGESASIGVNTAIQGNIAVGYQWDEIRAEVEVGYGSFGVNNFKSRDITIPLSGSVNATTVFVNGYWDIPSNSKWRSYIGAGIGVGFPNFSELKSGEAVSSSRGGTALAVQGKAGIQYELAKKSNVFLELKYQNLGNFNTGSGDDQANIDPINSFGLNVGYRQGF